MNNFNKFKLVCKKCGNEDIHLGFKRDVIHYKDGDFEEYYNGVLVEASCSGCCERERFSDYLYQNSEIKQENN